MKNRLYVAAGGGGDPIATAMTAQALQPGQPANVITFAWDHLFIDPLAGPRQPSDFVNLEPVGRYNYRLIPRTSIKPPSQSTLPRLAKELNVNFYLLDPSFGAQGLARQLQELATILDVSTISAIDVGGDIIGSGDEPELRSPLADALVVAALSSLDLPSEVLIAGPGLDGELSEAEVTRRCIASVSEPAFRLTAKVASPFAQLFEWHPAEANGLLWAAAMGTRGIVELRNPPTQIQLTKESADVWRIPVKRVLEWNTMARAFVDTTSLSETEARVRQITNKPSEIDLARTKATSLALNNRLQSEELLTALDRLPEVNSAASKRGIDYLTIRRLLHYLGLPISAIGDLRQALRDQKSSQYAPPLWAVHS